MTYFLQKWLEVLVQPFIRRTVVKLFTWSVMIDCLDVTTECLTIIILYTSLWPFYFSLHLIMLKICSGQACTGNP